MRLKRVGKYLDMIGITQSDDHSCGAIAALTVAVYRGKSTSLREVARAVGTTTEGTTAAGMVRGLRQIGIKATPRYYLTFNKYVRAVDRGCPVISYDPQRDHWVVVYGYTKTGLLISDPAEDLTGANLWAEIRDLSYGIVCS